MNTGFIGLGRMGSGMAGNLVKAGVPLSVFDTNPEALRLMADAGAHACTSVRNVVQESTVVFLSLPGPAQVEQVILGPNGILETIRPGTTVIDLSTSSVSLARRLQIQLEAKGASLLDAPVSGGPVGAVSGDLAIWVGGSKVVFEEYFELLSIIGHHPRHVGPIGTGTITKLAHNMVGYMIMLSLAEVFSVAVKAGSDPLELWEAMRLGAVGNRSPLDLLVNQFLPGTYEPAAFALELAHKDVVLATGLGKEVGVPMRLANLTLEEMTEALSQGWGQQDSRSFLKLQLQRAGVEIAVDPQLMREALGRNGQ